MADLDLTVLACEAGRSSGYLVRHGGSAVLVDCGPGVIRALERYLDPNRLTGVVITHEHADHSVDLVGLAFRLRYPTPHGIPIPLYVPAEMTGLLDQLDKLFGAPTIGQLGRPIRDSFEVVPLDLANRCAVDVAPGLVMTPFAARHAVPSAALRFETGAGAIAFSSDTGPTAALVDAAYDTDLFVCEATYGVAVARAEDAHGHLTASQAGEIAGKAKARGLLLTHLSCVEDAAPSVAAAGLEYSGTLQAAVRDQRYEPIFR